MYICSVVSLIVYGHVTWIKTGDDDDSKDDDDDDGDDHFNCAEEG